MSLPSWLSWMGPLDWLGVALAIVLVVQIVVGLWRLRVIEWPDLSDLDDEALDEPPAAPPWERR